MATKERKDMWEPIKGWVICKGHLNCMSNGLCKHSKLHKWITAVRPEPKSRGCYCSITNSSCCNCIHMTKEQLYWRPILEAY